MYILYERYVTIPRIIYNTTRPVALLENSIHHECPINRQKKSELIGIYNCELMFSRMNNQELRRA